MVALHENDRFESKMIHDPWKTLHVPNPCWGSVAAVAQILFLEEATQQGDVQWVGDDGHDDLILL